MKHFSKMNPPKTHWRPSSVKHRIDLARDYPQLFAYDGKHQIGDCFLSNGILWERTK